MKIAAVSEDGVAISQHFGRAPFYVVVNIENSKIISHEKRDKIGHNQLGGEACEEAHGEDPRGHGFDPTSQDHHTRMVAAIADCEVLLARSMGAGAYESMKQTNIRSMVTDIVNIDEAVQAYLAGNLKDQIEKLH